jgi:6-phosphogluconolactonase
LRFFIGTYTAKDGSQGIYTSQLDTETGKLEEPTLAIECDNPTFLALHRTKPYLYAIGESQRGTLQAFLCNKKSGRLVPHDEKEVPGQGPCHLTICESNDGESDVIVVANYGSGNVVSFPILGSGKIGKVASDFGQWVGSGPNVVRQKTPHAHGAFFDGEMVAVPDLGVDQVVYYNIDLASAKLSRSPDIADLRLAPGAGPRHLTVSSDRRYVYVVNELDSTVSVFDRRLPKYPALIQTISTLPEDADAVSLKNSTAEIELHPNGKFLYVSNRGHDSLAVFAVEGGKLTLIQHAPSGGKTPRFFCLDPTSCFLLACNQDSGKICVQTVHPTTGRLTLIEQSIDVSKPVCIVFVTTP